MSLTIRTRWRTWSFFHTALYINSCVTAGTLVFHKAGHTAGSCRSIGAVSANHADFTPFRRHSSKPSGTAVSVLHRLIVRGLQQVHHCLECVLCLIFVSRRPHHLTTTSTSTPFT